MMLSISVGCQNEEKSNSFKQINEFNTSKGDKTLLVANSNLDYYQLLKKELHLSDKEIKAVEYIMNKHQANFEKLKKNRSKDFINDRKKLQERTNENLETVIGELRLKKKLTFDRYYKIDTAKVNRARRKMEKSNK